MLPYLLGAVVVLGGAMMGAIWGMNKAADRMVGDKHRALEAIVDTGEVPASWSRRFRSKVDRLQRRGDFERALTVQREAKASYLHRLEALTQYAKGSPLVEDEETRAVLTDQLALARQVWERRSADEF
ncbi:MAG: hypothetical protein GX601_19725 [Anaerolineales bacterium]|nr:hypothetical protein [Anaerolineales bacterium]